MKFCKTCGANLNAVRTALLSPETGEKFDWSKTWLAEMLLSGEESVRRSAEIERLQGKTPEVKRRNEIKAGVITASVGAGSMLVLAVVMEGIVISGQLSRVAAEILSRIWIVGLIPFLIGLSLIFNGLVISRRRGEREVQNTDTGVNELPRPATDNFLPPAATNPLGASPFSVTDETTRHLKEQASQRANFANKG